jgi:hypothetical protein
MFGILNATKKASVRNPAPKNHAVTISRINPRIRLSRVARPMTPAALVTCLFSSI